MKWSVGAKIGTGFGLTLAILLVIGWVSYLSINNLVYSARTVQHTNAVLAQLESVLSTLKDADSGQQGFLLTGDSHYLTPFDSAASRLNDTNGPLRQLREMTADDPDQQRSLDILAGPDNGSGLVGAKLADLGQSIIWRRTRGLNAAVAVVEQGKAKQSMDQILDVVAMMNDREQKLLAERKHEQERTVRDVRATIIWGTFLACLIVLAASYLITRSIAGPLTLITEVATRIASGDLSLAVQSDKRADEVGELMRTFSQMTRSLQSTAGVAEQMAAGNLRVQVRPQSEKDVLGTAFAAMVRSLQQTVAGILEGVNVLSSAASQISASTTALAASATETATAVTQTTATVEEIRQTAEVASQKARNVADSAQNASHISQAGKQATEETILGMKRIRQQMESIADSMVRLSEQSQAIGAIIAAVDDLAQQSNLLAVNAAIEAAKAGEQGRGFSVVAQEVKILAEQSRQATAQVRTILSDIQRATGAAVMATEQGSKAVETGMAQSVRAGESIVTLSESVAGAAQAAMQIAASSQQQLVGMDQVVQAMESVKQSTGQNVDGARQLKAAARSLTDLGFKLKQQVEQYEV